MWVRAGNLQIKVYNLAIMTEQLQLEKTRKVESGFRGGLLKSAVQKVSALLSFPDPDAEVRPNYLKAKEEVYRQEALMRARNCKGIQQNRHRVKTVKVDNVEIQVDREGSIGGRLIEKANES